MNEDETPAIDENDGPSIGGPEGGQTKSHTARLPEWMPPLPVDFELTEREIAIAEIAAYKNAKIQERFAAKIIGRMRAFAIAMGFVVLLGGGGTTLGWYFVDRESTNRTAAINASRVSVLTENCMETNARNRGTLAKLDALIAKRAAPTPRQERSITATKLLIAALAPYRGDPRLKGMKARVAELEACGKYARMRLRA